MDHDRIDRFERFLNELTQQHQFLQESLYDWDSLLESGLNKVKDLEKICDCVDAKPPLLLLKEIFACGHGVSFSISTRVKILKDMAQLTQSSLQKEWDA